MRSALFLRESEDERITSVALACFLVGSGVALSMAAREAKRQNMDLVELVGRQLDLQLSRIDRSADMPKRFPDWDLVSSYTLQPGQCVEFRGADASWNRSSCAGFDAASTMTPQWFSEAYRLFISGPDSIENCRLSWRKSGYYRGRI